MRVDNKNQHLDTLHSDFAFIIGPSLIRRAEYSPEEEEAEKPDLDLFIYPNPAHDELFVRCTNDTPKDIDLLDALGRRVRSWNQLTGYLHHLPLGSVPPGAYSLQVTDIASTRARTIIVR